MKKIISLFTVAAIFTNMLSASAMVRRLEENSHFMGPVMVPTVETASECFNFDSQEAAITAEVAAEEALTLEEAVSAFEALDTSAYSTQSYYACFDEYEAAKLLLLSADATDEQKTAAASALDTAIKALVAIDSMVRSDTVIGADVEGKGVHGSCNTSYSYTKVMSVTSIPTAPHQNRACLVSTLYGGFDFGENNEKVISRVAFSAISNGDTIAKSYVGLRFEGSNDNVNWETIAKVEAALPYSTSAPVFTTYYSSVQTNAFRYVRFNTDSTFGRNETSGNGAYDGKLLGVFFFSPNKTYENVFSTAIDKYSAYNDAQMTQAVENAQALYDSASADDASINASLKEMLDIKVKIDALNAAKAISEYSVTSESWFNLHDAISAYERNMTEENLNLLATACNNCVKLEETVFTSSNTFSEKHNPLKNKANSTCGDPKTLLLGAGKTTLVTSLPGMSNRVCLSTYMTGGYDFGEQNSIAVSKVSFAYQSNYDGIAHAVRGLAFEGSNDKEKWETLCSLPSNFVGTVNAATAVSYETLVVSDASAYRYVRFNSSNLPFTNADSAKLLSLLFYGYKPDTTLLASTISEAEEFLVEFNDADLSAELEAAKAKLSASNQVQVNDAILSLKAALDKAEENKEAYEIIPLSYNENSIRVDEPDGIRFKSSVKNTVKSDDKTTEYGFLVTLESLVGSNSVEDGLKFGNEDKIRFVSGVSYGYDEEIGAKVDRVFATDNDLTYFTAVIFGVTHTPERLSEKIIVRPYIKYNGEYLYGTVMTKSVLDVAKAFRDKNYESLNETGKKYVQEILETCSEQV